MPHLQIDSEFRLMVAPSQESKQTELDRRRMHPGAAVPIRAWENKILVDHEMYSFCYYHDIPIQVSRIPLKSREDAIIWICRNQLKRTDLTDEMTKFLIGKQFCAEKSRGSKAKAAVRKAVFSQKRAPGDPPVSVVYDATIIQAAERVGEEYRFTAETIRKYGVYASLLEQLNFQSPQLVQAILCGMIYLSHDNLSAICGMTPEEIRSVTQYFLYESNRKPTFSKYKAERATLKKTPQKFSLPAGSIKEMPDFDPDAAVASLALTIPSWVRSIQRTESNTTFPHISNKARQQLIMELESLTATIESILFHLKEDHHG